jgi:cellulose synthase/poly-beta-1,6-N-acetylglucosamine synthase-like glycosyltransferase
MGTSFVFYDPTGRRWSRFRRVFGVAGVLAAVLVLVLALSIFSNAQLPPLGLPEVQHLADIGEVPAIIRGEKAARNVPYHAHPVKYIRNGGNPVMHAHTAAPPHEGQPLVFGYYVNWDQASMSSLRLHLSQLTHLIPEWLVLENGKGDVSYNTDQTVVEIAADAHLPILAEINNYRDGWQAADLHRALNSADARDNLVDNIYSNIEEHKFAGVCVDFEELKSKDRGAMVRFMEELRAKLRPAGLLIAQAVPADDDNYDLQRLGEIDDYLIPMVYDEHYQSSAPGPVASEGYVPATFFVVGVNAEENVDLIRREYREGHTIGNHTYDHPNIAKLSPEHVRIELSTTLRIIERELGHGTILFRPPYNADSEPTTPEEIVPIEEAQQQGYVTIAESIDPRDWEHGRTAGEIVNEVVTELEEGAEEGESNHLILLHDAGGDRDATLEALPTLIETLRGKGYRFVTLEDIMGRTRADIMPVPSAEEMRMAEIEGEALITKGNFKKAVGLLFLVAIYLTLLRSLVYGALAVLEKFKARRRRFDPRFHPPVSVIIAAFNEEKVIERTVRSVLENGYDDLELVVVDDGSKDRTLSVLHEQFGRDDRVVILTQPNAGKSAALNRGIAQARNNILIALDADTIFRRGTIGKLVRHFSDPRVGAVSGNARVGNRHTLITRFQAVEYIMGFNLDRRALDLLNAITVVPGAAGAWRKDLIVRLGGFGHDTLAEDTDLTLSIRRLGYEIRYDEEAVAWTEAPETTSGLAKQRFRWAFGTLQAVWKHRDATFNPAYGFLGMMALPSIWIFQVLLAALSPFAEVAMIVALFAGNWRIVLLYYLGLFLLELLTALLAYGLEGVAAWDVALLLPQRIYYRQLMYYVLGKSVLYAMRGRLVGWGKLERTATVRP